MGRKRIEISGQRFGQLTVIEYAGNCKWLCKCDCGRYKKVKSAYLRNGSAKSCGCLKGKPAKFLGCNEDCFNCTYDDCLKPDYMIKSKEEVTW